MLDLSHIQLTCWEMSYLKIFKNKTSLKKICQLNKKKLNHENCSDFKKLEQISVF